MSMFCYCSDAVFKTLLQKLLGFFNAYSVQFPIRFNISNRRTILETHANNLTEGQYPHRYCGKRKDLVI